MWRMRVVHSTGYAYEAPVTASFNEARLTPRSNSRQNVILNRVETIPATRSYRYVDYWGTAVTAFDLHAPHTELTVTSSSVVETERPEPPEAKVTWEELESMAVIDRFDEVLRPTSYTPTSKRVAAVGRRIRKYHDPAEAVVAAARWARSELDYLPGTTGVHSSGLDALEQGKGVCQDFAHLSLIVLRGMGIPARYVSGYLHPKRNAVVGKSVAGRSHAWIQAWTGGWWHYDPTNDTEISEQYISVGAGAYLIGAAGPAVTTDAVEQRGASARSAIPAGAEAARTTTVAGRTAGTAVADSVAAGAARAGVAALAALTGQAQAVVAASPAGAAGAEQPRVTAQPAHAAQHGARGTGTTRATRTAAAVEQPAQAAVSAGTPESG